VSQQATERLRLAAIGFLNPAPLMWDFEHPPLDAELARRYLIDRMTPAECSERLAAGTADIGLVPIAALAANPTLRVLPGCTIASKARVRSLLLVRRADRPLKALRSVAADTASRTTVAYARILFHKWGNASVPFLPMAADLDRMLDRADAAIIIGDPALLTLEERSNRYERTGEDLVYHDLAEEWQSVTALPLVSAVWAAGASCADSSREQVVNDLNQSRIHGHENLDRIIVEWSSRLPIPEQIISEYLSFNIHYVLDEECVEGMRGFFRMAAETGVLPAYTPSIAEPVIR
jgi:chorismate dehydratase